MATPKTSTYVDIIASPETSISGLHALKWPERNLIRQPSDLALTTRIKFQSRGGKYANMIRVFVYFTYEEEGKFFRYRHIDFSIYRPSLGLREQA